MNRYILVDRHRLFAFSEDKGFTAVFSNNKWEPSNISFLALLAEKDENIVQISSEEAMILTNNNSPEEYFEKLNNKLNKR